MQHGGGSGGGGSSGGGGGGGGSGSGGRRLREKDLKQNQFVLSVSLFESLSIFCTIKLCRTTCDKKK